MIKRSKIPGADEIQIKAKWGAIDVAVNDRLMFLANDKDPGAKNGSLGTAKRIDPIEGKIALELDDRCIMLDAGKGFELNYGYAATIHKSQGTTTEHCYVLASSGFDKHLAYVALSRHRQDVRIYHSDFKDFDHLKEVFSRPGQKNLANDYRSGDKHWRAGTLARIRNQRDRQNGQGNGLPAIGLNRCVGWRAGF